MAENSTLIEKLPPVSKAESPPKPTAPAKAAPTAAQQTPATQKAQTAPTVVDENPKEAVATIGVDSSPPPELTISGMQKLTYYSFVGDAVLWGLVGLLFFGKAFKDKAKVRFVSMATYGGLLIAIGFMFFLNSKTYYRFLIGENAELGLALRSFGWAIFAPVLFYIISRLIKVPSSDRKLYLTMFGLASGLFLFIGLSQLVDGRLEQLGLSVFPFLFSASLTLLLFMTLGSGASALLGKLKHSVTVVVFTIIGGWFIYPIINLLSHLAPNVTLYSLLLNGLDFAILSGLTYGLWEGMSSRTDRILLKPSFGKARRSSGAPFPAAVSDRSAADPAAKPEPPKDKPSFKKPDKPIKVSNN